MNIFSELSGKIMTFLKPNQRSLRQKVLLGTFWSAVERFTYQGTTFLFLILMARLLKPSDYGLVGLLSIFLSLGQIFIDGGFTNALIQKQDCGDEDYSTVFFYNLAVALFFYVILFLAAPQISKFYKAPELLSLTRVLSLNLIFAALSAINRVKHVKAVDFKTQAKVSFFAAVISGVIGVFCALNGFGVWAIVVQTLANSILTYIFFMIHDKWLPSLVFCKKSFFSLFSFGSQLLAAQLLNSVYLNFYSVAIGKMFSPTALGYFTRAEQLVAFPSSNIAGVISRVSFPVLSSIQQDKEALNRIYRKYLRMTCSIIFPLMIGLAALAEPVILVLLSESWLECVALVQILCFGWLLDPISLLNQNLLFVIGRSDLFLRLEFYKKPIAIVLIIVAIPFGVKAVCLSRGLYSLVAFAFNTYYTGKFINLGMLRQLRDIYPFLLIAILMGGVVSLVKFFVVGQIMQLLIGIPLGIVTYLFFAAVFKVLHFER